MEKFDFEGYRRKRIERDLHNEYFNTPTHECRLVDIVALEAVKFEMSQDDFRAISNLSNLDCVPARLVSIIVQHKIPVKV